VDKDFDGEAIGDGLGEHLLSESDVWKFYYRRVALSCPKCIYHVVAEIENYETSGWDCEQCGTECIQSPIESEFDA